MTTPTLEQLAANIDPIIRDYIDQSIAIAVKNARIEGKLTNSKMEQVAQALEVRIGEMEHFEREVRSHLGIFVQEG